MHGISKKDITNQSNNTVPTITFTEEHMGNLLTAYQSLRDLEKLLTIISGIDPENGSCSDEFCSICRRRRI